MAGKAKLGPHRWAWRSVVRRMGSCTTRVRAANTRRWPSVGRCGPAVSRARWARPATASTTPWPELFATLQTELLDRHNWSTRRQLETAIFEFIEASTTLAAGIPASAKSRQLLEDAQGS